MFIRKMAVVAAVAAIGLLAVVGSASATSLRLDPGNTVKTGATTITNTTSSNAVLNTNLGVITCTATKFHANINANSAATLTGTLQALTFTSCTDTIPVIAVSSCHLHTQTLPSISVTGTGTTGGSVNLIDVTVGCNITGGASACYYTAATANGTANNAASTIAYSNVTATTVTPTSNALSSALCGASGSFSVTLQHIVESGTNRTLTVTA